MTFAHLLNIKTHNLPLRAQVIVFPNRRLDGYNSTLRSLTRIDITVSSSLFHSINLPIAACLCKFRVSVSVITARCGLPSAAKPAEELPVSDALLLHHTKDSAHIPLHSCLTTTMFARRAVSTVARRAVTARPAVPARSFASSMKRCECAIFLTESGEQGIEAIGAGRVLGIRESRSEKKTEGFWRW